jgi:aminoglycoside phosphotransferase (APT) family kinase protein
MSDTQTNDAIHAQIGQSDALPPPPWPLLGEGRWGAVHDLGDGTVLKVVRRHGGLGSGEALHDREAAALKLLDGLASDYVQAPRLLASGCFDNGYIGSGPPLAGWLRLTRIEGRRLSTDAVLRLGARERDLLGERIGAAVADFSSEATKRASAAQPRPADTIMRSLGLARTRLATAELHQAADAISRRWEAAREAGMPVFIHGDLNPGNLIDAGPRAPMGLVDFAEAGWSLAEAEFRHFEPLGAIRDAIFRGYAARRGVAPDMGLYYVAAAANALMSIAIEGNAGHPRDAMRRMGLLRHCLDGAGLS